MIVYALLTVFVECGRVFPSIFFRLRKEKGDSFVEAFALYEFWLSLVGW